MIEEVDALEDFTQECRNAGLTDCVLLGMGGSSLAPEVIRRSFGSTAGEAGYLRLHVFDSTDAGALRTLESRIDLDKTLFIVATKSGGTIETLSAFEYFWSKKPDGRHFTAITDPGTSLVDTAQERSFRRVFLNDPNIGGRYSALSYFGLVPAALMGADVRGLLDRAGIAEQASVSFDSTRANSGLWVGITIGELARQSRDKLTFIVSEPVSSFGLWVEQLVAESTGKDDKGALPVADEPVGPPEAYGKDRTFVYLRNVDDPDKDLDAKTQALAKAGHPLITLGVHGPTDLGRICFLSMFATAVAGWVLGINPFDQPNVQEAKDNTGKVLAEYEQTGALPDVEDAGDEELRGLLGGVEPPHYVGILGFVEPSDAFDEAVTELRNTIREATKAATTFGYGPRYLHSTGQFHKGGPLTGHFLMLVHDSEPDVEVPGKPYTFNTLKNAQAIGDLRTLRDHALPAQRVRLTGDDPAAALRALTERIKGIL
jgi:glucose-6-phosphate isomerase